MLEPKQDVANCLANYADYYKNLKMNVQVTALQDNLYNLMKQCHQRKFPFAIAKAIDEFGHNNLNLVKPNGESKIWYDSQESSKLFAELSEIVRNLEIEKEPEPPAPTPSAPATAERDAEIAAKLDKAIEMLKEAYKMLNQK